MIKRRDFLKATTTYLAGIGLVPLGLHPHRLVAGARSLADSDGGGDRRDDLPPRTVGLRSLGGNFRFDPPGLRIEPAEELVWLNMGDFHTATAFHPDNAEFLGFDLPRRIPDGAEAWHSGMLGLDAGTEFAHRFSVEGVYDYLCQPHYSFGMVGRIIVGRPHDGPAVRRPLSELNEASQRVMPSVESIMGPTGRTYEWSARINGLLLMRAHGEPVAEAATIVRRKAAADEELQQVLDNAGLTDQFANGLDRLVQAVEDTVAYDALAARADEVKNVLRRGRATS